MVGVWGVLGLIWGSFLNVLVVRVNETSEKEFRSQGWRVFGGRSRCPKCYRRIEWWDNIPLLSFVILRGKCRKCKRSISWQYPAVELGFGLILATLGWMSTHPGELWRILSLGTDSLLLSGVVYFLLFGLLVSDLQYMTIPDLFFYPLLLVVGIGVLVANWGDGETANNIILAGLVAFGLLGTVWLVTRGQGMGFGDVEYALVMGLMLGWPKILVGLMLAFVTGAVVGIIMMAMGKMGVKSKMPFGPFLILGTVMAMVWGGQLWEWYWGLMM